MKEEVGERSFTNLMAQKKYRSIAQQPPIQQAVFFHETFQKMFSVPPAI
jgi:hypothetical protein